jgi:GNAT superfamily N-acetyltransferase
VSAVEVRDAASDDADAIGAFQTRCWEQAYIGLVPDAYLTSMTAAMRALRWRERIDNGSRRVLLALISGDLVGVASTAPTPHDRPELPPIELTSIYVDEKVHGTGVAAELLAIAISDRPAHLWVFEGNRRAQRFYAKHRFNPGQETQIDPDTGLLETRWLRR